jgi:hypothetical protein
MTYARQQLAEALQELAKEPIHQKGDGTTRVPSAIDTSDKRLVFPPAVANFLENTNRYTEATKSVSVGVY